MDPAIESVIKKINEYVDASVIPAQRDVRISEISEAIDQRQFRLSLEERGVDVCLTPQEFTEVAKSSGISTDTCYGRLVGALRRSRRLTDRVYSQIYEGESISIFGLAGWLHADTHRHIHNIGPIEKAVCQYVIDKSLPPDNDIN